MSGNEQRETYHGHSVSAVTMDGRMVFLYALATPGWFDQCPDARNSFRTKTMARKVARFAYGNVCRLQSIRVTTVCGITKWEWE